MDTKNRTGHSTRGAMPLRLALIASCVLVGPLLGQQAPKFYPDDPLLIDNDRLDVPERPEPIELSDLYDRFSHIFADLGGEDRGEAQNVNTLDEVPDSSWFTNRHARQRMTIEQLVRGPDQSEGPDPAGTWLVVDSKSQGLTPGFQIIDDRENRYVIKLDPVGVPELSSAAEVIATKLFYAFGYYTPENYIVHMRPENLSIREGTEVENRFGETVPLTPAGLQRLLRRVPRLPDGSIRVVASRFIPGRVLGPFRYHGTRSDDPNDVIPHENRRELRGLRLLAAWLNHDDTRAQNTQDTWVEEDGRHYVRHYLIDFGSTFGSGSVDLQLPNLSFHYWLDLDLVRKNARSFGLHVPKYRKAEWPALPEFEAVGRWESELYEPHEWRNDYPNPAFVRMTLRDAFWASKIVMAFTPEEIAAIVETGQYTDPEVEQYFLKVLLERQRKTARHYMRLVNPLDEFRIDDGTLHWANLAERHGFAEVGTCYRVRWSRYDNRTDTATPLDGEVESGEAASPLPRVGVAGPDDLLLCEISSLNDAHPAWSARVGVYLRSSGSTLQVVGIDRETTRP